MGGKNPKNEEEEFTRKNSPDEKFSGLAFKVAADPYIGTLTFFRIYSGKVSAGDFVINPRTKQKERLGRMVLMHSNKREEIKEAQAGDIIALVGLKDTTTGDTLCSADEPIVLERMEFPEPVIKVACEPASKGDSDKMAAALAKLAAEDPSFRFSRDGETITKSHEFWFTHNKQSGGAGQFAKVQMVLEPNEGEGFEFVDEVKGGTIPKEYIPAVVKGVEGQMKNGVKAGFPLVDCKVSLLDGGWHPVDSSAVAFEICGRNAMKEGVAECAPIILEPLMKVEVTTPEDYQGAVIGDLNSRRGAIDSIGDRGNVKLITAFVPLSEMFQYIGDLRGMSKGRASFSMEFGKYAPLPDNLAEELSGERKK